MYENSFLSRTFIRLPVHKLLFHFLLFLTFSLGHFTKNEYF